MGTIPSGVRSWILNWQVTVGKLNHLAPKSFPIIIYYKEGYFLRVMFQLLLIFGATFLKSFLGVSWCCTSNFSFAFNESPVVLTNFKRDFIFYKILHISFYQSLIFFPRVVQAHTTYRVCLSASLSCVCELLMKLRGPQSLQRVPFDWVCRTWINSPPEIPKCLAPLAHCLEEKDSLGYEGELL